MARVVQRTPGLLYLVVVLVFLFLLSVTGVILMYMEWDKTQKELADVEDKYEKLHDRNASSQAQAALEKDIRELGKQGRSSTVIAQLRKEKRQLTDMLVLSDEMSVGEVQQAYDAAYQQLKDKYDVVERPGLINHITKVYEAKQTVAAQIEQLKQTQERLVKEKASLEQDKLQLNQQHATRIEELEGQINALEGKLSEKQEAYDQALAAAKQAWESSRQDLDESIVQLNERIENLRREIDVKESRIREQANLIKTLRPKTNPIEIARKLDGEVIEVVPDEGLVYINIGSKDRVVTDLTFSVYPMAGIPADGKGKGKIIVKRVSDHTALAAIVEEDADSPIAVGDGIANVVFDKVKKYDFAVEGVFDLHGSGKATQLGTTEVKTIIKRFGGRLTDSVKLETDFLVLGERPSLPPKPRDDAAPTVIRAWNELRAIAERYDEELAKAQALSIPVLKTEQFLAFTGYKPERTLQR